MGFFDRFAAKKQNTPPPSQPAPAQSISQPAEAPVSPAASGGPANVKAQLLAAREKLEAKDLPAAIAIYEELLRAAGDRPDVLVGLSGDLGSCGYVEQIVELVAPRYDAEKHGPSTGLNLLQAYLATRNTTAAQHLLDILFGLNRPELEERLYGFSNALADLIDAERRGALPPPSSTSTGAPPEGAASRTVALASISKPIWAYGVETNPGILPPSKGDKVRRVAFGQLALLGTGDVMEKMKQPEDEFGRFCRGLPLWLSEMFYFAPHYAPIAAIGTLNKEHYALFGTEWSPQNIRELVATADRLDYVFTGALKHHAGDFELSLKVWEIKRFRERKTFTARWTPATADAELTKLAETIRMFMEWGPYPAGTALNYTPPAQPKAWCDTLGSSLSLFLADKGVVTQERIDSPADALKRVGERAASSESAAIAYLTLLDRASRLDPSTPAQVEHPLFDSPAVAVIRGGCRRPAGAPRGSAGHHGRRRPGRMGPRAARHAARPFARARLGVGTGRAGGRSGDRVGTEWGQSAQRFRRCRTAAHSDPNLSPP